MTTVITGAQYQKLSDDSDEMVKAAKELKTRLEKAKKVTNLNVKIERSGTNFKVTVTPDAGLNAQDVKNCCK